MSMVASTLPGRSFMPGRGEAVWGWWPIAAMLVVYSLITLVSAVLGPETRGRDLVQLEDAL
ncbi:hypothetical protein LT350_03870 [Mycolicibacterium smegmatis]|uniref:hypothetical protein n=1 Tax=Mycolicibacterium smegmatis TaxID=1772 RepID=UPI001E5CA2D6|nr:hypothetical protein [Mycolicibacterium smegmatis]UGU32098.1 hypothetical protein LT350_03870 [Mycolicibacterium smegmatis]ULN73926.1 hypothetical protein KZ782_14460 [Mycolicibacterium smegmatis]